MVVNSKPEQRTEKRMVKSLTCDQSGLKKGSWTPEEDRKLLTYIQQHGHGSWRSLPQKAGLQRCGKSCRLRWINYLRPDIKRGKFTLHEERTLIQLHALLGNRWSAIAAHLPKRTDNEIKNHWNTHIKKRLSMMGIDPMTHKPKHAILGNGNGGNASNISHMAQWERARLEAEARLVKDSKMRQTEPPGAAAAAATSSGLAQLRPNKMASRLAPPRCLDILKAWLNVCTSKFLEASGGHSLKFGYNGVGCDLESPTSILNFPEGVNSGKTNGGHNNGHNMSELYIEPNNNVHSELWAPAPAVARMADQNLLEGVTNTIFHNSIEQSNVLDEISLCEAYGDGNGDVGGVNIDDKHYWNDDVLAHFGGLWTV